MAFRVLLCTTITLLFCIHSHIVAHARDLNEEPLITTNDISNPNPNTTLPPFHPTSHYTLYRGKNKWPKKQITYVYEDVTATAKAEVEKALDEWELKAGFKFTQLTIKDKLKANIKFSFASGDHGDGFPFGGAHMAHTFPPPDGRVHFDNNRPWTMYKKTTNGYDFQSVALHEIGHALGLDHSLDLKAVMYESINLKQVKRTLQPDDLAGIKALYK